MNREFETLQDDLAFSGQKLPIDVAIDVSHSLELRSLKQKYFPDFSSF